MLCLLRTAFCNRCVDPILNSSQITVQIMVWHSAISCHDSFVHAVLFVNGYLSWLMQQLRLTLHFHFYSVNRVLPRTFLFFLSLCFLLLDQYRPWTLFVELCTVELLKLCCQLELYISWRYRLQRCGVIYRILCRRFVLILTSRGLNFRSFNQISHSLVNSILGVLNNNRPLTRFR